MAFILKLSSVLFLPMILGMYGFKEEAELELYARAAADIKKGCGGKNADIAFVIDNSASIWRPDYYRQLDFIQSVVKMFRIAPNKVRIAAVSFGDGVYAQHGFQFNSFKDEASTLTAVSRIPYVGGKRTMTDQALDYTRQHVFPESLANPLRQDAVRIGIVLTDGVSRFKDLTITAAQKLKREAKTLMFAIGVGKKVSLKELEAIATSKDYVYRVDNYGALASIRDILGVKICQIPTTTTPKPTTTPLPKDEPCGIENPADIVLVYDSTEVGPTGISEIRRGVKAFVQTDEMQHPGMRVGLISGECPEVRSFPLNKYKNKNKIPRLFDRLAYSELDALVGELRTDGFHPENGGRANARHIGILIITGKPKDPDTVRAEAEKAKRAGIEVFVVGAGNVVDPAFLRSLASEPIRDHVILGSDYRHFGLVGRELATKICKKGDRRQ